MKRERAHEKEKQGDGGDIQEQSKRRSKVEEKKRDKVKMKGLTPFNNKNMLHNQISAKCVIVEKGGTLKKLIRPRSFNNKRLYMF